MNKFDIKYNELMKESEQKDVVKGKLEELKKLRDKYDIKLFTKYESFGKDVSGTVLDQRDNQRSSAGDEIFLGRFDNEDILMVCFFHELGHTQAFKKINGNPKGSYICTITKEAIAWEVGMRLAYENGYTWDYYSEPMKYARLCIYSYSASCSGDGSKNGNWSLSDDQNEIQQSAKKYNICLD